MWHFFGVLQQLPAHTLAQMDEKIGLRAVLSSKSAHWAGLVALCSNMLLWAPSPSLLNSECMSDFGISKYGLQGVICNGLSECGGASSISNHAVGFTLALW